MAESEAKVSRIERRLERFLSNPRIDVEQTWETLLSQVLPFFRQQPMRIIIDVTSYEEHAQVIDVGLLAHSRVLPLVRQVMPGQQKWDQGFWSCIDDLLKRLAPHVGSAACTIVGESAFGCFPMVKLCQKYRWHSLFRIAGQHTCWCQGASGEWGASLGVSQLVKEPGKRFRGSVQLWQGESIGTELSICWEEAEEEALYVISDRRAGKRRLAEYRLRWRIDSMFQESKSRGWNWEECQVRAGSRQSPAAGSLSVALVAGPCIHHGKRERSDRADRRDKGIFRIGRLYLFDIERRDP